MSSTNKKKDFSTSSLVVSTGCSKKIKSYFSLLRPLPRPRTCPFPDPPLNSNPAPPPPLFFREGEAVVEEYWRRARQLEEELQKLEKLLSEERRVTECDKSTTKEEEKQRSVRCEREPTRLPDGSYVHEIRRLGRPWGRLVMQVSLPTVAENASTAFEVIRGMVSMKMEELCRCLMESMPMKDITGIRASEIVGKTGLSGCEEDNYMEAILLNAMDKMEGLVLEGLRIQMSSSRCESKKSKEASSTRTTTADECVVVVVLIQVRDPKEGHGAIGELMIGLIEAKILDVEGKRFSVSGVHVAGLSFTRMMVDGRNFLWSASLQSCRGIESNCCWKYVRNPDRVFAC